MRITIQSHGFILTEALRTYVEQRVRAALGWSSSRLRKLVVSLSDINGPRGGNADLRCSMEARINGIPPVAAIDEGNSVDRAVIGAAKKVVRAIDHQLGKLGDRKGH